MNSNDVITHLDDVFLLQKEVVVASSVPIWNDPWDRDATVNVAPDLALHYVPLHLVESAFEIVDLPDRAGLVEVVEEGRGIEVVL